MTNSIPIEQEIAKSAGRISAIALRWKANPAPTQAMADGLWSMAEYLRALGEKVESGIAPPPPPPTDPISWPQRDVENLTAWDGAGHYAIDITDQIFDGEGTTYSGAKSSVAIIRGSGELYNCKLTNAGNDGIKVLNGSVNAVISDVHVYGIGQKAGAHADAIQITGGVRDLTIANFVADVPNNDTAPGASPVVTSALIISSQDAPNGRIEVHNSHLYGGQYTVYNISKGSGNAIADLHFWDTLFYVSDASPAFGLFQCEAKPTFHGECLVIDFATGAVLSDDPWAWRR